MNQETLQRILDLIGRTGDRVVITDPAGENPYVLMGLDQYESLMVGSKPQGASFQPATAGKPQAPGSKPSIQVAEDIDPPVSLKAMASFNGKKKDIPLWRKEEKPSSAEASAGKPASPPRAAAPEVAGQGEEQFYLEPLE